MLKFKILKIQKKCTLNKKNILQSKPLNLKKMCTYFFELHDDLNFQLFSVTFSRGSIRIRWGVHLTRIYIKRCRLYYKNNSNLSKCRSHFGFFKIGFSTYQNPPREVWRVLQCKWKIYCHFKTLHNGPLNIRLSRAYGPFTQSIGVSVRVATNGLFTVSVSISVCVILLSCLASFNVNSTIEVNWTHLLASLQMLLLTLTVHSQWVSVLASTSASMLCMDTILYE